jgi:hypothetical protein
VHRRSGRHDKGKDRPRWRSKERHRHDALPPAEAPDDFDAWLQARFAKTSVDAIERLDLTEYLRDSKGFEARGWRPTERLRKLAIALESEMIGEAQPRGWLAVERIYALGSTLDPDDVELEISRAITAERLASIVDDERAKERILSAGRDSANRALAIEPNNPSAHASLGMLEYSTKGHASIGRALESFERALSFDSPFPQIQWARLYRAHCLHDLERWAAAVEAYSAVDPAFFVRDLAWRYDLLREQRAFCLLKAGDRARAAEEFLALVTRYEAQPELARWQMLQYLRAAAAGELQSELAARVEVLSQL